MFTKRQIAAAGFFGIYAGCLPLTVNLGRLPYVRGAVIGVFFGAFMHLQMTFIYILLALCAGWLLDDPILHRPITWILIGTFVLIIQALISLGCQIMGGYFLSPNAGERFDRDALYQHLKQRDQGKTSVLHDVVVLLETRPPAPDRRFSSAWTVLFACASLLSIGYWLHCLTQACLNVLYLGVPMDATWSLGLAWNFIWPLIVMIALHLAVLGTLCRDVK